MTSPAEALPADLLALMTRIVADWWDPDDLPEARTAAERFLGALADAGWSVVKLTP